MSGNRRHGEDPPQLQIWSAASDEVEVGALIEGEGTWTVYVLVERTDAERCQGRLSFRHDGERFDTAPVVVEEDEQAVIRRAGELPPSTLRQFLSAVRG